MTDSNNIEETSVYSSSAPETDGIEGGMACGEDISNIIEPEPSVSPENATVQGITEVDNSSLQSGEGTKSAMQEEETEAVSKTETVQSSEVPKEHVQSEGVSDIENLFSRFEKHKKCASEGKQGSLSFYLDYTEKFSQKEKQTITKFREQFKTNNDITVLDSLKDEDQKTIVQFIHWMEDLPKGSGIWSYRFQKFGNAITKPFRWIFSKKKKEKKRRKELDTEKKYLDDRYFTQQQFYSKRADKGKTLFFRIQKSIFLLSVVIPIVALLPKFVDTIINDLNIGISDAAEKFVIPQWIDDSAPVITAIFSAIIAYLSSKDKLYSWLKHWYLNRDLSERLKKEYALYQGRSGEYANVEGETIDGHTPVERKFREKIEAIVDEGRERLYEYGSKKSETK